MSEIFPAEARLLRGRAAVTACPGQDSCGLCASACAYGAIKKPGRVPQVDHALCVGCGACVKACPQLNMRLVDGSKGEYAEITLKCPLAFLPEPDGETRLFDGKGRFIGAGKAVLVQPLPGGQFGLVRVKTDRALLTTAVRIG